MIDDGGRVGARFQRGGPRPVDRLSRKPLQLRDPAPDVLPAGVEALALRGRVEDAEVRLGVGARGRRPLPAAVVAGRVAVHEPAHEPALAGAPVDVQILGEKARDDHAHAVVHPAGRRQLPHPGIDDRIPGHAGLPRLEAVRIVVPFQRVACLAERTVEHPGMRIEDGVVELAPHQLVDPRPDPLLRRRLGRGQREPRAHAFAHRDRAEAQVRREPGGAGDRGPVTVEVVAMRGAVEEGVQPLPGRRRPPGRDAGRIRPQPPPARLPERVGRSLGDPPRKRGSRSRARRIGLEPPPPRAPEVRVDGVDPAMDGADLAALEDDPVLVRADFDPVAFQGIAYRTVPVLRVRAVVAVPGHEGRLARACEGRKAAMRCAAQDDEPGPRGFQRGGEIVEAGVQEPEAWMGVAMRLEQGVVHHEHRRQRIGPPAGVGERDVVRDAEIASEPVDGSHYAALRRLPAPPCRAVRPGSSPGADPRAAAGAAWSAGRRPLP